MAQKYATLTFPDKPRNLKIGAELNRGAWGAVFRGDLEGRPVAVKRIHELLHLGGGEEERRKLFEDFREECKRLQSLSHPHVVGFIGAFSDPKLGPVLVMEKMQENLRQFLNRCKKNLRLPKQLRISLEIIRGVAFLHQQTPPLVHRDLNDKNVMFSFEGVVKIGDFGQSKLKKDLYFRTGQPGMVTFMPPEALDIDESKYNESLDIFSVGVLMLEIGTQQEPLVNLRGIGIIREVERRERDLKALGADHPLRQPVLLCLKDNPKERPRASDLQRDMLTMVDEGVETSANTFRSQIATLQAALKGAMEENAARKVQESKLTSQLEAKIAIRDANIRQLEEKCEQLKTQKVLPRSPLPPSLGKEVRSMKLPDMPMGAAAYGGIVHNSKVYISAYYSDGNAKPVYPVLVYSTDEHKWSTLPERQGTSGCIIAEVNNHVTLIGGFDISTGKVSNTLSTWYEEEGQWKSVLPPMPTVRISPAVICHNNLLLVTGGVAEDDSTVLNTTDVLDLTTMKWTTPKELNLPVPLWLHHLALCVDYLYLVGGATAYPVQSLKDDNSQAWRAQWSDVQQTAAPHHSQPHRVVWTQISNPPTLLPTFVSCGGRLYTVGGRTRNNKPISTVYTYITARGQWVYLGDMSERRVDHCAVPLSNSVFFVAGGQVVNEGKLTLSPLTELLLL